MTGYRCKSRAGVPNVNPTGRCDRAVLGGGLAVADLETCDECGSVRQRQRDWWTRDGLYGYCDRCRRMIGGEGWRPAGASGEEEVASGEGRVASEEAPPEGGTLSGAEEEAEDGVAAETPAEYLARMGAAEKRGWGARDRGMSEGAPDVTGLVLNFKVWKESKKMRNRTMTDEEKRRVSEAMKASYRRRGTRAAVGGSAEEAPPEGGTPNGVAGGQAHPPIDPEVARRREYQRAWRAKKMAASAAKGRPAASPKEGPAPAAPKGKPAPAAQLPRAVLEGQQASLAAAGDGCYTLYRSAYTVVEIRDLLKQLRGMTAADREALWEMI